VSCPVGVDPVLKNFLNNFDNTGIAEIGPYIYMRKLGYDL